MSYEIKIVYETGNSFSTSKETKYLDMTWNNLDIAKLNLKSIKEHYDYVEKSKCLFRKKDILDLKNRIKDKTWFNDLEAWDYNFYLLKDDGEYYAEYAFWTGFFERLKYIEIEEKNSDMKYEF